MGDTSHTSGVDHVETTIFCSGSCCETVGQGTVTVTMTGGTRGTELHGRRVVEIPMSRPGDAVTVPGIGKVVGTIDGRGGGHDSQYNGTVPRIGGNGGGGRIW